MKNALSILSSIAASAAFASAAAASDPGPISLVDPTISVQPFRVSFQATTSTALPAANPFAQGPISVAEFIQHGTQSTIVLDKYKGYSPIKSLPQFSVEADVFAGVQTSGPSQAVGGVAALGSWSFSSSFGVKAGVGLLMDLSKQFQLSEVSPSKLGVVFAFTLSL